MADIVGEPIPNWVAKQINIRQKIHGSISRTEDHLKYLNTKTAWLKLASGVGLNIEDFESNNNKDPFVKIGGGFDLARRYVLFGGVSSLNKINENVNEITDSTTKQHLLQTTLTQRGRSTQKDNIIDPVTGMYNVNARQIKDGGEFGYVPMPGLISADIKNLNRGSIKKADVKIKCYNREQFDILDVLYLRLGYTVLLEWGYSTYISNDDKLVRDYYTLVEDPEGIFKEGNTHRDMLNQIVGYREKKNGNYDGLLAKVSNFSWEFNTDGTYDITLSLISLGDVIESLKTNITPSIKLIDSINNYISDIESPTSIESGAKNNIISANMLYYKMSSKTIIDKQSPEIYYTTLNTTYRIGHFIPPNPDNSRINYSKKFSSRKDAQLYLKENYPGIELVFSGVGTRFSNEVNGVRVIYIENFYDSDSFATSGTLSIFGSPIADINSPSENPKDVIYFEYDNDPETKIEDVGFYMRLGYLLQLISNECIPVQEKKDKDEKDIPLINIDYDPWSNKMLCYHNQISYDPQVCLVRSKITNGKGEIADLFPQLPLWRKNETGYAYQMNIYVNFIAIQNAIDENLDERGDLALYPFLESICIKINESLGGINNLEPIIDEETNTIRIIDGSFSANNKKPEPSYNLEAFGYNGAQSNFVRNFSLKTEITPEYATMITIGATAGGYVKGTDGTMFSKYNKGIIDRYQEKYVPPRIDIRNNPDEARDNFIKNSYGIRNRREGLLGYKAVEGDNRALDPDSISTNLSLATEYYKYLNTKAQEKNEEFNPSTIGFIPFNFGITLDGISGIKIYNKLDINTRFLPKNYTDSLKFIIKGVNHKIENQDWETSLETVVTPQNIDSEISYKLLKELIDEDLNTIDTLGLTTNPGTSPGTTLWKPSGYGEVIGICTKSSYNFDIGPRNINQPKLLAEKITNSFVKGEDGTCARGVKNVVEQYWNNFNTPINKITSEKTFQKGLGGDNAKSRTTHELFIKQYGYKMVINAHGIPHNEIQNEIAKIKPNVGDIMAYWDSSQYGIDKNKDSHSLYGHIVFWNGTTWFSYKADSSFVYRSKPSTSCWNLVYLKSPDKKP